MRRDLRCFGVFAPVPNGSANLARYLQRSAFPHSNRGREPKDIATLEAVPMPGQTLLVPIFVKFFICKMKFA